jgi:hypothetical protein
MKNNDVYLDSVGVLSVKPTTDFPAFTELGGSETAFDALIKAQSGLALFSGRVFSGKTTAIAALANELQRAGRNVVAVRAPHVEPIPNVEEHSGNVFGVDFQDFLIQDKPEVVIVDDIRSSDAALFVANLIEAGILVIASIHAYDPWMALSKFLYLCESKKNQLVADSLLFCYGLEIGFDPDNPDKVQDDATENTVLKTEGLFASVNVVRLPSFEDPLGEWKVVQVPSRYNPRKFLSSHIFFPNEKMREFILSYGNIVKG